MLNQAIICIGCWQHLRLPVPLRGAASMPFRAFGIRPSRMNPNTCTICEMMFKRVMKARQIEIDATILFADLRGYTGLSQSRSRARFPRSSTPSTTNAQWRSGSVMASSTRRWATQSWPSSISRSIAPTTWPKLYGRRGRSRSDGGRGGTLSASFGGDARSGSASASTSEKSILASSVARTTI